MSVAMMSAVDWVCLFCAEKAVVMSRAATSWRGRCSLVRHGGWGGAEGAECVYVLGDDVGHRLVSLWLVWSWSEVCCGALWLWVFVVVG